MTRRLMTKLRIKRNLKNIITTRNTRNLKRTRNQKKIRQMSQKRKTKRPKKPKRRLRSDLRKRLLWKPAKQIRQINLKKMLRVLPKCLHQLVKTPKRRNLVRRMMKILWSSWTLTPPNT